MLYQNIYTLAKMVVGLGKAYGQFQGTVTVTISQVKWQFEFEYLHDISTVFSRNVHEHQVLVHSVPSLSTQRSILCKFQ